MANQPVGRSGIGASFAAWKPAHSGGWVIDPTRMFDGGYRPASVT